MVTGSGKTTHIYRSGPPPLAVSLTRRRLFAKTADFVIIIIMTTVGLSTRLCVLNIYMYMAIIKHHSSAKYEFLLTDKKNIKSLFYLPSRCCENVLLLFFSLIGFTIIFLIWVNGTY